MAYSFNRDRKGIVFASTSNINASFKDLAIVCNAIRYKNAEDAGALLEEILNQKRPVFYSKYNKYMGSRHELGGQKGRYPKKCAAIVKKVLTNAMANAEGKGESPQDMYVVHASANKTIILPRMAPKGELRLGHSMGRGSTRMTNLEFARVELALGYGEEEGLSGRMKKAIETNKRQHAMAKKDKPNAKQQKKDKQAPTQKPSSNVQKVAAPSIKA